MKYKLGSSSKVQFVFFDAKHIHWFCQKSENHANSGMCMLFASLWPNAYKNQYVIYL